MASIQLIAIGGAIAAAVVIYLLLARGKSC
jgi:hypothetical protein